MYLLLLCKLVGLCGTYNFCLRIQWLPFLKCDHLGQIFNYKIVLDFKRNLRPKNNVAKVKILSLFLNRMFTKLREN